MILDFRTRRVSIFAANQDRYYDITADEFRTVSPGFRVAIHIGKMGYHTTWVWNGFTIKKALHAHG